MLTFRQFRKAIDSYGGNLRRWPEPLRGEAKALLDTSAEARSLFAEAQRLDQLIEAASMHEDAMLWRRGADDAALARLRSGVTARLESPAHRQPMALLRWMPPTIVHRLRRMPIIAFGMATGSSAAVAAGFLIGFLRAAAPAQHGVLALLQFSPL